LGDAELELAAQSPDKSGSYKIEDGVARRNVILMIGRVILRL